jgi:hypothetical protein
VKDEKKKKKKLEKLITGMEGGYLVYTHAFLRPHTLFTF